MTIRRPLRFFATAVLLLNASALPAQVTNSKVPTDSARWLDPAILAAVVTFVGAFILFIFRSFSEKRSINRAVLAKIKRLVTVIPAHEKWYRELKDKNYPLIPFSHVVYTSQIKKIGALHSGLVATAVQFYGYVDFINALQASRQQHIEANKSSEFDDIYLHALKNCIDYSAKQFDEDF